MDYPVMLVTVTQEDDTRAIAHGIYPNTAQTLQGLHNLGIYPGFNCVSKPLFNEDGSPAGALFASGRYMATVSLMPLSIAVLLAEGADIYNVPDTAEGIKDAGQ